jgi:hypothetical protein
VIDLYLNKDVEEILYDERNWSYINNINNDNTDSKCKYGIILV